MRSRREVREETAAEVEVKELLFIYECFPPDYGFTLDEKPHCVDFIFRCALCDGSEPRLPDNPDKNEVAVHWIPLDEFPKVPLVPQIQQSGDCCPTKRQRPIHFVLKPRYDG